MGAGLCAMGFSPMRSASRRRGFNTPILSHYHVYPYTILGGTLDSDRGNRLTMALILQRDGSWTVRFGKGILTLYTNVPQSNPCEIVLIFDANLSGPVSIQAT